MRNAVKMPLTFIVVLFYISEFLYQIQISIVQQTFVHNEYPYSDLYFLIPFHSQHTAIYFRAWGGMG